MNALEMDTSHKVLIVDDDMDMLYILRQILQAEGYQVEQAVDGEEAVRILEEIHISLVITDVMLPKMNGWKLCQKIKQNLSTQQVPILVITAKKEEVAEWMSYESGANAYISKPFKNEEFILCVKKLLEKN